MEITLDKTKIFIVNSHEIQEYNGGGSKPINCYY